MLPPISIINFHFTPFSHSMFNYLPKGRRHFLSWSLLLKIMLAAPSLPKGCLPADCNIEN